jgi:hypothetical protein
MRGRIRASDGAMRTTLAIVLVLVGCGGNVAAGDAATTTNDAAGTDGGATTHDGGAASDAGAGTDAFMPGTDAATTTCTPTTGTATISGYCDLLQFAVIAHDGAPSDLIVTGRVFSSGSTMPSCALIDGVDIVQSDASSPVVQHLPGIGSFAIDYEEHEIARGVPVAAITGACGSDDPAMRFDTYGVVVRGHIDGGTFEAHCARAEGGGRWPPALRITCHQNVDQSPNSGNAMVNVATFMGMSYPSTMMYAAAPHGPGGALMTMDSTIHIIAYRSPFDTGAPIPSHDTTGWTGGGSESGTTPSYTQLTANASSAEFDTTLCPPPMVGPPPPNYIPPPVFLARMTGQGGHGAYSTEVFVNQCNTISM